MIDCLTIFTSDAKADKSVIVACLDRTKAFDGVSHWPEYSGGCNFLEHALIEVAKTNKFAELLHRTFKSNQSKLNLFKNISDPL